MSQTKTIVKNKICKAFFCVMTRMYVVAINVVCVCIFPEISFKNCSRAFV